MERRVAVMRTLNLILGFLCGFLPLTSATLEKLTMDQMIDKSTAIVRGRIIASHAAKRGPVIYTFSKVEILEHWKGSEASSVEVAIPGGAFGNLHQSFSGAPKLEQDAEYVLFLWTGKSGVTQVIGLSQGLFDVRVDENGETVVERPASGEIVLAPNTGMAIQDQPVHMQLSTLRARVRTALEKARQ